MSVHLLLPAISGFVTALILVGVYFSARKNGFRKGHSRLLIVALLLFALCMVVWGVLRNFYPSLMFPI